MEEKVTEENVQSFEVKIPSGRRKGLWNVTLEPEMLTLSFSKSGEEYQISKSEASEKIELLGPFLTDKFLSAKIPKKQLFELKPEQAALLKEWLGPPTVKDLKITLKKRLKWCLPLGVMFIFTSLPMSAKPEAGLEAIPFDIVGAILGVVLIGLAVMMRFWPRRELFLVNSAWFLVGAVKVSYDIIKGSSWLWSILVLFLVMSVIEGVKQYNRFEKLILQDRDVESQLRLE
jgi:hypothetical protein